MKRIDTKPWSRSVAYLVVATMVWTNSGCLWLAAGAAGGAAATYAYCKAKVCDAYAASFTDAWAASITGLGELSLPVIKEERNSEEGFIESRAVNGDLIRVYLDRMDGAPGESPLTRICVRVATFGDTPLSEEILHRIGTHLVMRPSAATPGVALAAPVQFSPPTPLGASAQTGEPPLLPPPMSTQVPNR